MTDVALDYREPLLHGRRSIGVWGVGHLGYTTLCHFAERGVRAIGTDIDAVKVELVNRGESPLVGIERWLDFEPANLFRSGQARATTDWRELVQGEVLVHFVCVPTERDGKPNLEALADVCRKMATLRRQHGTTPPLVVVESTIPRDAIDEIAVPLFEAAGLRVGRELLLGVAPRRDWFAAPERSLRVLPRVVGGTDQRTTRVLLDVLGICCENLLPAPDHRHAALVKSVENAYRQMEIALANELSLAYPQLDIRAVLELAGTKWNVGTFRPSFGIGGYCIPLASHYVLEGAERPELLTLLRATIASSEAQARRVAEHVIGRGGLRRVGILGLSYTAGTKVWSHSPTIAIAATLRDHGVEVKVHDPYYAEEEIRRIVGAEAFSFPDGLGEFDAVLVATAHDEYRTLSAEMILECLTNCHLILDNAGLWAEVDFEPRGIEYHQAGDRDWLGSVQEKSGPG